MENEFLKYLLWGVGLGDRWCHILNTQGILTIEDLKQNLHCPGMIEILQSEVEDEEVTAFSNLITMCKAQKMEDNTDDHLYREASSMEGVIKRSVSKDPEYQGKDSVIITDATEVQDVVTDTLVHKDAVCLDKDDEVNTEVQDVVTDTLVHKDAVCQDEDDEDNTDATEIQDVVIDTLVHKDTVCQDKDDEDNTDATEVQDVVTDTLVHKKTVCQNKDDEDNTDATEIQDVVTDTLVHKDAVCRDIDDEDITDATEVQDVVTDMPVHKDAVCRDEDNEDNTDATEIQDVVIDTLVHKETVCQDKDDEDNTDATEVQDVVTDTLVHKDAVCRDKDDEVNTEVQDVVTDTLVHKDAVCRDIDDEDITDATEVQDVVTDTLVHKDAVCRDIDDEDITDATEVQDIVKDTLVHKDAVCQDEDDEDNTDATEVQNVVTDTLVHKDAVCQDKDDEDNTDATEVQDVVTDTLVHKDAVCQDKDDEDNTDATEVQDVVTDTLVHKDAVCQDKDDEDNTDATEVQDVVTDTLVHKDAVCQDKDNEDNTDATEVQDVVTDTLVHKDAVCQDKDDEDNTDATEVQDVVTDTLVHKDAVCQDKDDEDNTDATEIQDVVTDTLVHKDAVCQDKDDEDNTDATEIQDVVTDTLVHKDTVCQDKDDEDNTDATEVQDVVTDTLVHKDAVCQDKDDEDNTDATEIQDVVTDTLVHKDAVCQDKDDEDNTDATEIQDVVTDTLVHKDCVCRDKDDKDNTDATEVQDVVTDTLVHKDTVCQDKDDEDNTDATEVQDVVTDMLVHKDAVCQDKGDKNNTVVQDVVTDTLVHKDAVCRDNDEEVITEAIELQDVVTEMSSSTDTGYQSKCSTINMDVIELQKEVLNKLGLISYFPEKISLQMAMKNSSGKLESLADVPWYFLNKMLMLNYSGRDDIISENIRKGLKTDNTLNQDDETVDAYQRMYAQLSEDFSSPNFCFSIPHPMDVLISVFRCSSNILRQILCEKMFVCKLGIPFILPSFMEDESMFLLWSLRNILLEFEESNNVLCQSSIVKVPTSIVSCLRLGEISRSKSKFLNNILNSHSHPTYYHRDCENGMNNRILSDGLIEVAWHLPSKKSINDFDLNKIITFLNMRGDGLLEETSRRFLCQVSNVVLVIADINVIGKQDVMDSLKSIASDDAELVLILTKESHVKPSAKTFEDLKYCVESVNHDNFKMENVILDFNVNGEKNFQALKQEMVKKLNECVMKRTSISNFENLEGIAKLLHISVDQDSLYCSEGHKKALTLMNNIQRYGANNLKTAMLPLQCAPWQEWAKLNKEQHRREKNCGDQLSHYMDRIFNEKKHQRKEQIRLMEESHTLLDTFLCHLLNSKSEERLYYLKWLKLYLDDKSRKILPGLQMECSTKWNLIRQYESGKKMVEFSDLKSELTTLENKLSDSSLGLEHLLREIAQAYEAAETLEERDSEVYKRTIGLPRIMAEIMLLGFPLELMDGDAAHIPLTWIKAVLEQLKQLIGDKRIFVLSVLGIQSSGKSTMLNTMFGLQFAVAAGRCTRGVYAQLLPLCKEYSSKKYDYILVVDTEGLRAAELGGEKLQHDNEIATLVVGLGDVTLVNIKGENVSEMEDVLQIVIHALLKMKLVNKNLALQPSCFFIHQNVPAPDASQQLRSGQQKLIETLDRVTKVAGKQEDAPQFTKFSQLIDFDINTNISYFSDLWRGDPPMAPANRGYSENVNTVKQTLLTDIMEKRASYLNISKFSTKLNDLWNGVLNQNFVFSFKNNLEMQAYSSLDDKISDILWSLKKTALEWQSNKENEIVSSEHGTEELSNTLISECYSYLIPRYNAAKLRVEDIFKADEDHSIVEQWRSRTFRKLHHCYEDIIQSTTESIHLKLKARQIQIDQRNFMNINQVQLMKEAKKVAENLRLRENSQNLGNKLLKDNFNEMWEEWIMKLPQNVKDSINIEDRVNKVLYDKFFQDHAMVAKALENLQVENLNSICLNFEKAMKKYVRETHLLLFKRSVCKKTVNNLREIYFACIKNFVEDAKYPGFKGEYAQNIMQISSDMIEEMKDYGLIIGDADELGICMAICMCQYATYEYSKKYQMENVINGKYKLGNYGIHPYFEEKLFKRFPSRIMPVLFKSQQRGLNNFMVNVEEHVVTHIRKGRKINAKKHAEKVVSELHEDAKSYIGKKEIQDFRDEYLEEIIKMVINKVDKDTYLVFKKNFKIQLAVHVCYFTLPTFCEKHKRYRENTNPREVLKRDYYGTYFQMFKNSYNKITDEKALSRLLCERLSKAVEQAVDKDMARELADDVRNNVAEIRNKPAFLKAVLLKLLEEDNFEEFYLYLKDTATCFEKWISFYTNNYLFPDNGNNRYSEIASRMIASLLSKVCKEISSPMPNISKEMSDTKPLHQWIIHFHQQVTEKIPIPLHDLLSLIDGYDILNLDSFTTNLDDELRESEEKLRDIFHQHTEDHLRSAHEESVYKIMFQECKGCTEKCPLCAAPCTLNSTDHTEDSIKHLAKEHYPQACGEWTYKSNNKLATENCSTSVASSNQTFMCKKTNYEDHLYMKYQEIYPYWHIDGDPSVEASPYWKWFLVKYESPLAERFKAERPDIPIAWRGITKDNARASVKKFTSST